MIRLTILLATITIAAALATPRFLRHFRGTTLLNHPFD